ncbi:hypothetical protein [Moorena producens]|uniref:hypothetical protein n=1 Tax=Moorena producens TaxID=1155739 RepID=UPI003C785B10
MSQYTWPETIDLTVKNKVGIGTDTPENELEVIGDISATNLTVSGELHVLGQLLGAAQDTSGTALRICCGKTPEGSTNWQVYDSTPKGLYVDIDTSACGFKSTPIYIANLHGDSANFKTTGGSSPYNRTAKGFRIYVIRTDSLDLTPDFANHNDQKWHIQWIAIGN